MCDLIRDLRSWNPSAVSRYQKNVLLFKFVSTTTITTTTIIMISHGAERVGRREAAGSVEGGGREAGEGGGEGGLNFSWVRGSSADARRKHKVRRTGKPL